MTIPNNVTVLYHAFTLDTPESVIRAKFVERWGREPHVIRRELSLILAGPVAQFEDGMLEAVGFEFVDLPEPA